MSRCGPPCSVLAVSRTLERRAGATAVRRLRPRRTSSPARTSGHVDAGIQLGGHVAGHMSLFSPSMKRICTKEGALVVDPATLGRLAYDSRFNGEPVPVIAYRLTNVQGDEYPARWALPESDIMRALEYFIERDDRRPPFVHPRERPSSRSFSRPLARTRSGSSGKPEPSRASG
jgi:hypothetical protein